MIADSGHVVGNMVGSCKDESKLHQCLEENWEDAMLKISKNGKSNNNSCELYYDTRSGDDWDKESVGNIMDSHSSGDSNEAESKIRDTSHGLAADGDSPEKVDPVFYMDKNVTACDLPEIVVCFKEDSYHVVKDICVDEGVPVQEKFLFGEKDSVKCSANSNQCGSEDLKNADKTDVNSSETKSSEDSHSNVDKTDLNSSETKSSEESHSKVDESEFCNDHKTDKEVEESSKEDYADAEGSSNCNQESLIVTDEVKAFPVHKLHQSEMPTEIESEEKLKDVQLNQTLTLGDILSREDKQKSLNHHNNSNRPEERSPSQLQDKEKGRLETKVFETETKALETALEKTEEPKIAEEKLTTTSQEPNKIFNDPEKPETENREQKCLVENTSEEDKLLSSRFGETSFSAAESVSISGHITYSGPIAFSGSLSVRSDASTTSGRSFAFPILQSEWNSSPVRMAKADKRRQKGGWRHTLLCCRFS